MFFKEVAVVALISSASFVAGWASAGYEDTRIYARDPNPDANYMYHEDGYARRADPDHQEGYARDADPNVDHEVELYARDADADVDYEAEFYTPDADPDTDYDSKLYVRDAEPYNDPNIDLSTREALAYEAYKAQHYRRTAAAKEAIQIKMATSSKGSASHKPFMGDATSDSSTFHSAKQQTPGKPDFTLFDKPSGRDVRSACPGLNALANHYFLPHNGKGITKNAAVQAMADGLNVGQDVADLLWGGAHHWKLTHKDPTFGEVFDLDEVSRHGGIEHDGSLTRLDAAEGDNRSINPGLVAKFMATFKGGDVTSEVAAKVLDTRIKSNKQENPNSDGDTAKTNIFSWGNLAMLIGTMGDVDKGVARGGIVHTFLSK